MRHLLKTVLLTAFLNVLLAVTLVAGPIVNLEVTLSDDNTGLISGRQEVKVKLYSDVDISSGSLGDPLWDETFQNVEFNSGLMSVELGHTKTLTPNLLASPNMSFVIEVTGFEGRVQLPLRYTPLTTYALLAKTALRVDFENTTQNIPARIVSGNYDSITGLGTLTNTLNVNARLNVDSNTLVVDNATNRVGVATANPSRALGVNGDIHLTGDIVFPDGTTLNTAVDIFANPDQLTNSDNVVITADNDRDLSGKIGLRIGQTERLTILNGNNTRVGIGTTTPVQELDVNGAIRVRDTVVANAGTIRFNSDARRFEGNDGIAWRALDVQQFSGGGWALSDLVGAVTLVDRTDKVGIGLTNPTEKLEVVGTISANQVIGSFVGDGSQLLNLSPSFNNTIRPSQGGTGTAAYPGSGIAYYNSATDRYELIPTLSVGEILLGDGIATPSVGQIIQGSGISINATSLNITVGHFDTSTQNTITLNQGLVFQGIHLDDFGHVSRLTTSNLDDRYLIRQTESSDFVSVSGDVLTGGLTFNNVQRALLTSTNQDLIIFPDGTGKVGVKTLAPLQDLDVSGAIRIGDTVIEQRGSIRYNKSLNRFEGFNGTLWKFLDHETTSAAGWIFDTPHIRLLNPVTKVGIGVATPLAQLHVGGDSIISGNLNISSNIQLGNSSITDRSFTGNWTYNGGNIAEIDTLGVTTTIQLDGTLDLGTNTITDGTIVGNWDYSNATLTNIDQASIGNFTISSNTIQNTTGTTNITVPDGSAIVLDAHIAIKDNTITGQTDQDTTISAAQDRNVTIEGTQFKDDTVTINQVLAVGTQLIRADVGTNTLAVGTANPNTNAVFHAVGDVIIGPRATLTNQTASSDLYIDGNLIVDGRVIQQSATMNTFEDIEVLSDAYLVTEGQGAVGIGTMSPTAYVDVRTSSDSETRTALQILNLSNTPIMALRHSGRLGLGIGAPTALLHLDQSALTNVVPLKFTQTALVNTAEAGAVEYDGIQLYITDSGNTRRTLVTLDNSQTLSNKRITDSTIGGNNTLTGNITLGGDTQLSGNATVTWNVGSNPWILSASNVSIDRGGSATVNALVVDNIGIDGNTIQANTGSLLLQPASGQPIQLDTHYRVVTNTISGITDNDSIVNAFANRAMVIEGVEIQDFDISEVSDLRVSDSVTITGNLTVDRDSLIVDAANNQVMIGTNSPSQNATFQVVGDVYVGQTTTGLNGEGGKSNLFVEGSAVIEGTHLNVNNNLGVGRTANTSRVVVQSGAGQDAIEVQNQSGTQIAVIKENGRMGIATSNPNFQMAVQGTFFATTLFGDGSNLSGIDSLWEANGTKIFYQDDNVGIGLNNPTGLLHLGAGTSSVPSLIINPGVALGGGNLVSGAIEYNGTNLSFIDAGLNRRSLVSIDQTQTITNKTFNSNTISGTNSVSGALNTIAGLQIGDGGDSITLNAQNWTITPTRGTFPEVVVDNLNLNTETLSSSATLNLTATNKVAIEGQFVFDGTNRTLTAATDGQELIVEGTSFDNGDIVADTNTFVVKADTNQVGFGTAAPAVGSRVNITNGDLLVGSAAMIQSASVNPDVFIEGNLVLGGNFITLSPLANNFQTINVIDQASLATSGTGLVGIGTTEPVAFVDIISTNNSASSMAFRISNTDNVRILTARNDGKVGVGVDSPSAFLHLKAGAGAIPSLLINAGTLINPALSGAIEYDGTNLYFTDNNPTRRTLVTTDGAQTLSNKTITNLSLSGGNIEGTFTTTNDLAFQGNNAITISSNVWVIDDAGDVTVNSMSVGNLALNGTTLSSDGVLQLTPAAGNVLGLDSHFEIDANQLTGTTATNSILTAATGQAIDIEGAIFKDDDVSIAGNLGVNGGSITSNATITIQPAVNNNIVLDPTGAGDTAIDTDALIITANTLAINNNNLTIDGNGKVGISSANVTHELEVGGTILAQQFIGDGSQLTGIDAVWKTGSNSILFYTSGNVGIGTSVPSGNLHIGAGSATEAPLLIESGTLTSVANQKSGAIEYDGTNLYFTDNNPTRRTLVSLDQTQTLTNKTVSSGTLSGTTSLSGNFNTTATTTIGDGDDDLIVDALDWGVDANGKVSTTELIAPSIVSNVTGLNIDSKGASIAFTNNGEITLTPKSGQSVQIDSFMSIDNNIVRFASNAVFIATGTGTVKIENVLFTNGLNGGGALSDVNSIAFRTTESGDLSNVGNITQKNTGVISGGQLVSANNLILTGTITSNADLIINPANNFEVNIGANDFPEIFVAADGRVGIATDNPISGRALSVSGDVSATSFHGDGSNLTNVSGAWTISNSKLFYNDGAVGIGSNAPVAPLHISSENGFLVEYDGSLSSGIPNAGSIPIEGSGVRMMWYPRKVAFRAGTLESGANDTNWNDSNIGNVSFAFGQNVQANGTHSTVSGGRDNKTTAGDYTTISGGRNNQVTANYGTIAGGRNNLAGGSSSAPTVGGGQGNNAQGAHATIAGGQDNNAIDSKTTVGGGSGNTASQDFATVGGGRDNTASGGTSDGAATVAGGRSNAAQGNYSSIGGGQGNAISTTGQHATIAGGESNSITNINATIGGGETNAISSQYATIAGGQNNDVSTNHGVIAGGKDNSITGNTAVASVVGGGENNAIRGNSQYSVIPGGNDNLIIDAQSALAAGTSASALHNGAFVWADSSGAAQSFGNNQFIVRAAGHIWMGTTGPSGVGDFSNKFINTSTGAHLTTSGTWTDNSDKTKKENYRALDEVEILEKIINLPIYEWNYIVDEDNVRHIGAFAQDFYKAFGLGRSNRHISSLDTGGVSLVAIKGLHKKLEDKDKKIDALESRIERLEEIIKTMQEKE